MTTLPIKKKWFDMILSGEKKEEYREISDYYNTRFRNIWGYPAWWGERHKVRLRNGYSATSPSIVVNCTLAIGYGHQEWGAEPNRKYFILRIIEVEASTDG